MHQGHWTRIKAENADKAGKMKKPFPQPASSALIRVDPRPWAFSNRVRHREAAARIRRLASKQRALATDKSEKSG
jgi:hypothetical protein